MFLRLSREVSLQSLLNAFDATDAVAALQPNDLGHTRVRRAGEVSAHFIDHLCACDALSSCVLLSIAPNLADSQYPKVIRFHCPFGLADY